MTFQQYLEHFERILNSPKPEAPYDNPDYFNYAKLNWSRMNRWMKHGLLTEETVATMKSITSYQKWIIITEPWCGDASHVIPFLELMARASESIEVVYQLRDKEPFLIDSYLTKGGKSIPKLIIRDGTGTDLATWGPRPEACQLIYAELTERKAEFEEVKIALQHWYNEDAGLKIQEEMCQLLKK